MVRYRLEIEGIAYDSSGEPTQYGRSWVRGDRTRTYLERDLARSAWPDDGLLVMTRHTEALRLRLTG